MTDQDKGPCPEPGPEPGPEGKPEAAVPAEDPSLSEALAAAEANARENWSKYLRASAELDNVRKRAARDVEQARKYGVERLAGELLGVVDSLEMGVEAGPGASPGALLEGKKATLRLLLAALEKFGIVELSPAGQPFDPQLHEALSIQPAADTPAGSVVTVVQKGYQLNGRLLRPARVIVAGAPPEGREDGTADKSRAEPTDGQTGGPA